jgi:hypothetical protein
MAEERLVKLQVQLPENLRSKFKSKCALENTTMNQIVVDLVEKWTHQEEPVSSKKAK